MLLHRVRVFRNLMVLLACCIATLVLSSTALGCSIAKRSSSDTVKADISLGSMADGDTVVSEDRGASPAHVLRRFVSLVREEAFDAVIALLAAELRVRYDVESLRADYEEAGSALWKTLDQMERALSDGGLVIFEERGEALLPLGGGRAVRMVRETEGWRIASLH